MVSEQAKVQIGTRAKFNRLAVLQSLYWPCDCVVIMWVDMTHEHVDLRTYQLMGTAPVEVITGNSTHERHVQMRMRVNATRHDQLARRIYHSCLWRQCILTNVRFLKIYGIENFLFVLRWAHIDVTANLKNETRLWVY
jgi:hypothetical protein